MQNAEVILLENPPVRENHQVRKKLKLSEIRRKFRNKKNIIEFFLGKGKNNISFLIINLKI